MQTSNIAVIAFNHISPFHLSVPCLFFGENRDSIGIPAFHLTVCTAENGPVSTTTGFKISVDSGLKALHKADIVIVPSWRDSTEIPPAAMLDALKAAHSRGAIIVGLCLGTFVLAAAGLLDGRKATTHWGWADQLQQMYPLVSVDAGVLYIDEGDVITSAGVAAGIDCCLHIIRRLYGAETAARLARRLVVPPHRQGGQAQYIEHPIRTPLP
ncbi:MAG TPA: DJ-1/PfpI family protein, partial [Deltaproteobacteria bacterium]|nr:DJ-1/PfpI family protein [Deltaproteobacteria bacterium]